MSSFTSTPVSIEIYRNTPSSPWSYPLLDQRQRKIAERVRKGGQGALLVSELAPVITLGRRTPSQDVLLNAGDLNRLGIELHPTDRGGLATYHGPGQWVLFPVDRLEALTGDRRGVRQAVETFLEIACHVGRIYDPQIEIRSGRELGVWSRKGKVASVGIHIEQGILLHGLDLNGFKTPQSFMGLRPCGMDAQMDFLLKSSNHCDSLADFSADFLELGRNLIDETLKRFWVPKNSEHKIELKPEQGLTVESGDTITAQQLYLSSSVRA